MGVRRPPSNSWPLGVCAYVYEGDVFPSVLLCVLKSKSDEEKEEKRRKTKEESNDVDAVEEGSERRCTSPSALFAGGPKCDAPHHGGTLQLLPCNVRVQTQCLTVSSAFYPFVPQDHSFQSRGTKRARYTNPPKRNR